jgi:hypothetical protein
LTDLILLGATPVQHLFTDALRVDDADASPYLLGLTVAASLLVVPRAARTAQ